MDAGERLWPLVEGPLGSHDVAGLAVAVVHESDVFARGFGVRDIDAGSPVTPETMFHLASVSKPFVATAVVSLATTRAADEHLLALDAPVTDWIPELTLADGRQGEVTARGLLSHTSGLPDVADYGWHDPQLGDDALSEFAGSLSGWRLNSDPGTEFSYSNAGYELLGLLLSRVTGTTFEDAMRQRLLVPLGMREARSCAPRYLRTWPPHRTWGCRSRCPRAPTPTPDGTPPARPSTPAWSSCAAGWGRTSSRPSWTPDCST